MKKILLKELKKYIKYIIIIIAFIFINMYVLTLSSPVIGKIVDLLIDVEQNSEEILQLTINLIGISILFLITRFPWRALCSYVARSFEKDLKDKIFEQLMKIRMVDLQNIKNGELMSYITKDVGELRSTFFRTMAFGVRVLATAVITIPEMILSSNLKLTIVTLCPIVVTIYLIIKIKSYVEKSFKKSQKFFTGLSEYVQESTDGIRTIKVYTGEMNQLKKFIKKNKALMKANNSVDVYSTLLSICINVGFGLCYGISLIYGANLISDGIISIGDFVTFNGYISLFYGPVTWLPSTISRFKRAQISYQRLDKVFQLEREKINLKSPEKQQEISGDIVIKDLNFNYPDNIEKVLHDINLTIKQGETLGIIGTIGSGKTTLMNLLLRLYSVNDGKIFIDGKDINQIPIEVLRENICYITQDNFLFSTTIKENIRLFKDDYEDEQIRESTEQSMLKDEIEDLRNGIETIIGERGVDLSGGQKQRVVISRAFLQNSNFVIFDDTFSALDNKTEEKLLENLRKATKNKTCIIISNRISDVKDADNIIVLDKGEIIQKGKHEDLINEEGLYAKFYFQQSSKEKELLI